jgi:hypothetical protein
VGRAVCSVHGVVNVVGGVDEEDVLIYAQR